jgi:hypothetical protein
MTTFYCLRFQTSPTWRARSVEWYSLGTDHIENTSSNSTLIVARGPLPSNGSSTVAYLRSCCLAMAFFSLFRGSCLATGLYATIYLFLCHFHKSIVHKLSLNTNVTFYFWIWFHLIFSETHEFLASFIWLYISHSGHIAVKTGLSFVLHTVL